MRPVFVETNFLVDLLRPREGRGASELYARHGDDLCLYLPWCCASEAKRTLNRIISEDLDFVGQMVWFAAQQHRQAIARNVEPAFAKSEIDKLQSIARKARVQALESLDQRLADVLAAIEVVQPTPGVVQRTVGVFAIKSLNPFDEMVLGAVLEQAHTLQRRGVSGMLFCTTDSDLHKRNAKLVEAYQACGLTVRSEFQVD